MTGFFGPVTGLKEKETGFGFRAGAGKTTVSGAI
jgi:hypothetical protein